MSVLCAQLAPPPPEPVNVQIVLFSAVREKFSKYDVDGSGSLHPTEVQQLLMDLSNGASALQFDLEQVMTEMDQDSSGAIDLDEFLPWWRRRGILAVFEQHDADESGTIDAKELESVMLSLGISSAQPARGWRDPACSPYTTRLSRSHRIRRES